LQRGSAALIEASVAGSGTDWRGRDGGTKRRFDSGSRGGDAQGWDGESQLWACTAARKHFDVVRKCMEVLGGC